MNTPYLRMLHINKRFPGVKALDDVSIEVEKGEVMGLLGENGAGKSTLMKILSGVLHMDSGTIEVAGENVEINTPQAARVAGISIIHQELNVIGNLSIAENMFLGVEKRKGLFIDSEEMEKQSALLLERIGLDLHPNTLVQDLSIAQQQMVEVAKALSFNAKLIVMDEPTSSLSDTEVKILLGIITSLSKQGVSIIFISHRLNEVFAVAQSVCVMRDGKMIEKLYGDAITEKEIVTRMVGRELGFLIVKEEANIGDVVLEVSNLSTKMFLEDISFSVRKGEILGFGGLVGSGRTEVMRAIFGIDEKKSGSIRIDNEVVDIRSPKQALQHGIGFVPEDRKTTGLILGMCVRENMTISYLQRLCKGLFVDDKRERDEVDTFIDRFSIKTPHQNQIIKNLSGGNQQKVVIAKWLMTKPRILIMDEPTRGIDVGAKKEVHRLISELAQQGLAIILISSDMQEVLGMSDRIIVMNEGRISGELSKEEACQERIMSLAIAHRREAACEK